ncbi:MAG: DUF2062 domain-containing protein [Desulfobacterales bacterium]|jgi:uncharacterized protein (DUF2062 family)
MKTKLLKWVRSMLKEGMSLKKISLSLALGVGLGIFPVLGVTTILCTFAAFTLRLNLPAIQVVNFMVYPLQIVLLAPFYGAGSWLFNQQGWQMIGENLIERLQNDFWGSMANLWDLTLYAILTWLVISPLLILILYSASKPVIRAVSAHRSSGSN